MSRFGLAFAGAMALQSVLVAASDSPSQPQTQPTAPDRPPTVRVTVDVVPVDVQVLDRQGEPVTGLGAEKFTVTINGRRHRVLSAELIETRIEAGSARRIVDPEMIAARTARGGSQLIMLAIDCTSFSAGTVQRAVAAARDFLKRLPAEDLVGLFAYPVGPDIEPTADRAVINGALDAVVGQRDSGTTGRFRLRPSDIVDIATEMPREDGPLLMALARRECGDPPELNCVKRLSVEATTAALYHEAQANVSIGAVQSLLQKMGLLAGRKVLVLVSSGVIASDRPGGRPDVKELGSAVGREAAKANTTVYTLHIDTEFQDRNAAETASLNSDLTHMSRDRQLRALWLDQFSAAGGGTLFRILGANSEYAFNRIIAETSSYYLLAVEATGADWNGLAQEIKVKVDLRHAMVRSRRWVTMPRKGATRPATPSSTEPASSPVRSTVPATVSRPRIPLPAGLQPMADAFERGDDAGVQRRLDEARDLANLIRGFRTADPPWPEMPRLAAVFALELAVAGLRSDNGFARDQGARLLAEYTARVRQPLGADRFECAWLWAEAAALGGLLRPTLASGFVARALTRCPHEPRLHLAGAIVAEQHWLSTRQPGAETSEVMERYAAAMKFPETALEARVRGASFLLRSGRPEEALALLDDTPEGGHDTYVGYLAELVRGRVLSTLGRVDAAIAAWRAALVTWPGAQSARVALMTLLFARGDRQEAAALADAVETAGDEQFDPWWTYQFGDFRAYPTILDSLRDLAR